MYKCYNSGRFSSKYNHSVPTDKLCVLKVVARMIFQFSCQKTKSITAACIQSLKLKILFHPHQIQLSCDQEPC
jgi:hypothetical protein